jgi:hypothetical protein
MKKFISTLFTIFTIMLYSNLIVAQTVTVNGNAYLENQSTHDSIQIIFERTAPSSLFDTVLTNINGEYSISIEQGIYKIYYSKKGYFNWIINDTALYSNTTLQNIILYEKKTLLNVPSVFPNIQLAIDISSNGDTILVESGIYYENLNFNGKNITLASEFILTHDTSYISNTIIDGNQNGRVIEFVNGEDSTAIVIGFTLTNGHAFGPYYTDEWGGGIYCNNSSPMIKNVNITENIADGSGGGLCCCVNSNPKLINVEISNNNGYNSGGIDCYSNSNIILINVKITGNTGVYTGGIGLDNNSDAILKNVTISNNTANNSSIGSAISCSFSYPSIYNSIITNNTGKFGVYNESGDPFLFNTVLWNNGDDNFYNCNSLLGYNVIVNSNSDSCDAYNNIQLNPLLNTSNFSLQFGSPCIDAGSNDYVDFQFDFDGNCRTYDGNNDNLFFVDMGAYEYEAHYLISLDLGNDTTICEGNSIILDATNNYYSYNWNDSISFNQTINIDTTGYYNVIVSDGNGCIAYDNITVIVNPTYYYTDNNIICEDDSLLWHGTYYKTTGQYFANYQTINTCDSIYELNLTVNPTYNYSDNETICDGDSLLWHGTYYKTSGQYFANYQTINSCDSVYELNLTVNSTYYSIDNESICEGDSLLWIGNYYSIAGQYFANYQTVTSCDSIYELNLNIIIIDTSITQNGTTLTANASGADYQWITCGVIDTIPGEISQSYTATANGSYAVIITQNGCIDTSSCYNITSVGIKEPYLQQNIAIYPNPTTGIISILGKNIESIEIVNIEGQMIKLIKWNNEKYNIDLSARPKGIYMIKIITEKGITIKKIVLE